MSTPPRILDIKVLDQIAFEQATNRPTSTYRELADKLKEKHYSRISFSIKRLKKKGLIRCDFNTSRSCRIPPENQTVFEGKLYHIVMKG